MCQMTADVLLVPLTPLEELLKVHPVPWSLDTFEAWKGADPSDKCIRDAHGFLVDLIDDAAWRPAIVEAVNSAAAQLAALADAEAEHRLKRLDAGLYGECPGK